MISGQTEVIRISVGSFTYDSEDELGVNTYRVSVAAADGASISNGNDGSVTVSNIPANQDVANIQLQVDYRDDVVLSAEAYSQVFDITANKNIAVAPIPRSSLDQSEFVFPADSTGAVASDVTFLVTPELFVGDTLLQFTDNDTLMANQWRVVSITATTITVTDNDDGTFTISSPSSSVDRGSFIVHTEFRGLAEDVLTRNFAGNWTKAIAGQDGENGLNTRIDFAYANNITGSSGFSTTDSTLPFRGTHTVTWREGTTAPSQSTTASDYEWAQWTGTTGATGPRSASVTLCLLYTSPSPRDS